LKQVKAALDRAALVLPDVEAFAVAAGPGSFTGLRIGLATAKSFAATLGRPCFGIPTLHAVAFDAGESNCTVGVLPAGRGEVFAQLLAITARGQVQPLEAPVHISPDRLLDRVSSIRSLKWAGEGALQHAEAIKSYAIARSFRFLTVNGQDDENRSGDFWRLHLNSGKMATSVGRLALMRLLEGEESLPQDVTAIYVRPSDAELNTNELKKRDAR